MGNLRDIRRRIRSVRNTSQITRAMQMVASAKMRRAQEQAIKGRAYIRALSEVLYYLQDEIDSGMNPLLSSQGGESDLVVLVNTDRGLCGGLNASLMKLLREEAPADAHYITIGRKLNPTLAKLGMQLDATWTLSDPLALVELKPIFDFVMEKFKKGVYKRVFVVFTGFVNTMVQRAMYKQLLPIVHAPLMELAKGGGARFAENGKHAPFILEPSPSVLLESILPMYVFYGLVQIILEARASEHSARMVAMKGATENAKNIIDSLTLEYNKARQAQITNELLEITTAMKAME